jgi:hypothetical protein
MVGKLKQESESLCLATSRSWLIRNSLEGDTASVALESGIRLGFWSFGIFYA